MWDWRAAELSMIYQARLGPLEAFAFSRDGTILATAGSDGIIVLLDPKEQRQIGVLPANTATILDLAFSPSGKFLASGSKDRSVRLWDVTTLREVDILGDNDDVVVQVAFTSDEKSIFAFIDNGTIKVWDLPAILRRNLLWRTASTIEYFTVSPDKRTTATIDNVGRLHVYDLASGTEIRKIQTGEPNKTARWIAISFWPTDPVIAWEGWNWFGILNYDSGQTNIFRVSGRLGYCNPAFSPNGREVAFASPTHIMIWDMAAHQARPFVPIAHSALALAFSPNGSLLAAAHNNGSLTLWERASGRMITNTNAHPHLAFEIGFSPDGRLLCSGGSDATGKVWDVLPNGLRLRHTLRGHVGWMGTIVFSPDSRRIVSTSNDDALKIWDVQTGLEVGTIYGHHTPFAGFAFTHDGNALYSASKDGDVRIWQAPPLASLKVSVSPRW